MIIYENTKSGFLDDVFKRDIDEVVLDAFRTRVGQRVGASEIRSWRESLTSIAKVLNDDAIPEDCGIAVEYGIPQSMKRIDLMVSGRNAEDQDQIVVVELKQWAKAHKTDKDGVVKTRFASGDVEVMHPSYQAWSYCELLKGFNEAVYQGNIALQPCAYLHNCVADSDVTDPAYAEHICKAPVFLKGDGERERLRSFIQQHFRRGDKGSIILRLEGGRIRPSKQLADAVAGMIKGNREFVLVDDQKLVFENILSIARAVADDQFEKRVVIIEGGPGTGKSVVALNSLAKLSQMGLVSKYVSKNAAPRAVFQAKLNGSFKKTFIENLFSGSGAFSGTAPNSFDFLLVDEAHRLNEKSGLYSNLGENQIKELIESSKCSVFFIDEDQRVTWKDIGSSQSIAKWASTLGARVTRMTLASQFRCNGSDGYLAWLDNALQIRATANLILETREYDFRVCESPNAVRDLIIARNAESNRARMVAGYCWDWASKKNSKAADVILPAHDFQMQWNLTQDGSLWIVAKDSVNQIGCIHTCQGLEVDYIGVIIGPDLIVREGRVITRPERRSKHDQSIKGYKALLKKNAAEATQKANAIIKNTYRTLMTRGMKGCYIFCEDDETLEYFRSMLVTNTSEETPDSRTYQTAQAVGNILPFRPLERSTVVPFVNSVPLVDLKLAAGRFSAVQSADYDQFEWIELSNAIRPQQGMFVAQVVGESMNRRIPNGAWCLFRLNPAGSRQGKVVVAQHRAINDPDLGGSFTVKVYESEKSSENGLMNTRVTLKPDSTDPSFEPLVFFQDDAEGLSIIAEFIRCL